MSERKIVQNCLNLVQVYTKLYTYLSKLFLPAFRVRGHVERRSFHTDPGAIVLYWHVAPQGLGPFVQECKTPKCVESLDSHRDVSTGRKPEI